MSYLFKSRYIVVPPLLSVTGCSWCSYLVCGVCSFVMSTHHPVLYRNLKIITEVYNTSYAYNLNKYKLFGKGKKLESVVRTLKAFSNIFKYIFAEKNSPN